MNSGDLWLDDLGREEETRFWEKTTRLFCHWAGTVGAGEEMSDGNSGAKAGWESGTGSGTR